LPDEVSAIRARVRDFIAAEIEPAEAGVRAAAADGDERAERRLLRRAVVALRERAKALGLWNPHLPPEWGGMGLGPLSLAAVSAECGRNRIAPYVLNCQAPDEGNMHTLLHHGTAAQRERYLRPLAEGRARSCFALTEPEVAGSDPTEIRTTAVLQGDRWVLNGHKWFISGARDAAFAIVIAKTDPEAEPAQAGGSPQSLRGAPHRLSGAV
jgi:acyl-CoA dehydrogenase